MNQFPYTANRAIEVAAISLLVQFALLLIGPATLAYQALLMGIVVLSTAALGDESGRFDIRQPWSVLMVFHFPFWVVGTLNAVAEKGIDTNWAVNTLGNYPLAMMIVSVGFFSVSIGYLIGLRPADKCQQRTVPQPWNLSRLFPLTLALYLVIWIVRYSHGAALQSATFSMLLEQSPLPAYVRTLTGPIPLFLILIVWGAHHSNPDVKPLHRFAIFITVGELVWAVIMGTSKSLFVLPVFLPMIPYIIFKKKIPFKSLILSIFMLLFVAYPYASALREVYFISDGPTRAEAREVAFRNSSTFSAINTENVGKYTTQAVQRTSGIGALDQLIQLESDGIIDINGEFYWRSLVGLVPRFLWEDKPILLEGVYFSAYLQGWRGPVSDINPSQVSGSVAPTMFGSFYWNFGWLGVVLTSLALGYFSAQVFSLLKRSNDLTDPASFIYYVSVLSLLDLTESEVVKFPSSLVWSLAIAWAAIRVLDWQKKTDSDTS